MSLTNEDLAAIAATITPVRIDWNKPANVYEYDRREYMKAYRAKATRARQLAKLYELIDKYPDEAKAHLAAL
jgi:hypothetical protein